MAVIAEKLWQYRTDQAIGTTEFLGEVVKLMSAEVGEREARLGESQTATNHVLGAQRRHTTTDNGDHPPAIRIQLHAGEKAIVVPRRQKAEIHSQVQRVRSEMSVNPETNSEQLA